MPKVLVLYYSSYGHMEQMADAIAEGARSAGAEVDIRRVPETAPAEVAKRAGFKADIAHPVIDSINALADYDAIVVGSPTRFGRMSSQTAAFLDQAGGLWASGALNGKVGADSRLYSAWRTPVPALITWTAPASVLPTLPIDSWCVIAPVRT